MHNVIVVVVLQHRMNTTWRCYRI